MVSAISRLAVRGPRVREAQAAALWGVVLMAYPLMAAINSGSSPSWGPVELGFMVSGLILWIAGVLLWRFARSTFVISSEGIQGPKSALVRWSQIDTIFETRLITVPALTVVCKPLDGAELVSTQARRILMRLGVGPNGTVMLTVAKSSDRSYAEVVNAIGRASDGRWPVPAKPGATSGHN